MLWCGTMNKHKGMMKVRCRCGHNRGIFNNKSKELYCAKCKSRFVIRLEDKNV
jgi:ribosomal protein S27E